MKCRDVGSTKCKKYSTIHIVRFERQWNEPTEGYEISAERSIAFWMRKLSQDLDVVVSDITVILRFEVSLLLSHNRFIKESKHHLADKHFFVFLLCLCLKCTKI